MKTKGRFFAMLLGASLLTSCAPKILYTESVGFVDYSSYLKDGIFLTESNSVSFDYDAMGSVTVVVYSGDVSVKDGDKITKADDIYGTDKYVKSKMVWRAASPEGALDAAVAKAVEKGGDGLINIKISPTTEIGNYKAPRSGFLVTGMAIRRK